MNIRRLLLGFAAVAPLISFVLIGEGIIIALLPLFLSHMLLLYGSLVANSQWFGPVITRFQTKEPEVWLTIDDGPSPQHTLQILDLLERFDARATFFVIGRNAEKFPHLITEILTRGHALANHTFTHPAWSFWCAGPGRISSELDRCAELLRSTPERRNRYFRAPVGMKSLFLHSALTRRELVLIGWSVRGLDTVQKDAAKVAARIERALQPGAIILLHEGHRTESAPEFHLRCLELTLATTAARGYRCVLPIPEQLRGTDGGK